MQKTITTIFLILLFHANYAQNIVSGKVIDAATKEAIPYVHIGIANKNYGTISTDDGNFQLKLPGNVDLKNISISFSCIGYKLVSLAASAIKKENTVLLHQDILALDEVVITDKQRKIKSKKIGAYRKSVFNFGEANTNNYGVGKEYGIAIPYPKHDYRVKSINFQLSENTIDSVLYRFNIYEVSSDGIPKNSILKKQLFVKSYFGEKLITLDVTLEAIQIKETIVITIEPVRLWYDDEDDNLLFYKHAKGYSEATYHRKSSMSPWLKDETPVLSIFLDVTYEK